MEHTKHVWRAALLLAALPVLFLVVRHFMLPSSFGQAGYYRYDSIGEYMNLPLVHGAAGACQKCHEAEQKEVRGGKHASVSCEVCHGPLADHAQGDKKTAVMPVLRSAALCAYCHQKLEARPKTFPQVDFKAHLAEQGADPNIKMTGKICLTCHESHNPSAK